MNDEYNHVALIACKVVAMHHFQWRKMSNTFYYSSSKFADDVSGKCQKARCFRFPNLFISFIFGCQVPVASILSHTNEEKSLKGLTLNVGLAPRPILYLTDDRKVYRRYTERVFVSTKIVPCGRDGHVFAFPFYSLCLRYTSCSGNVAHHMQKSFIQSDVCVREDKTCSNRSFVASRRLSARMKFRINFRINSTTGQATDQAKKHGIRAFEMTHKKWSQAFTQLYIVYFLACIVV